MSSESTYLGRVRLERRNLLQLALERQLDDLALGGRVRLRKRLHRLSDHPGLPLIANFWWNLK